jgi:4-hydroxy-tetrahydrodipicolinate synthase
MSRKLALSGAFTALVTPFTTDGSRVDHAALEALVDAQIRAGIGGLVPCGTTGESPVLSPEEHAEVVMRTVRVTAGRAPVIAGAGSNDTRKSVALARLAVEQGADAVMVVMPYYNKPTQQGLFEHIATVARAVSPVPVVLYNVPARTVTDLAHDTLQRLVEAVPNVVAIKDASGNVLRCQQTVRALGSALTVLCGDDALTVAMIACGARGVVSVTSNLFPAEVSAVCRAALSGRYEEALRLHLALLPVHDAMFVETSPGPVKAALGTRGGMAAALRLPLTAPSEASLERIVAAMRAYEARGTS